MMTFPPTMSPRYESKSNRIDCQEGKKLIKKEEKRICVAACHSPLANYGAKVLQTMARILITVH